MPIPCDEKYDFYNESDCELPQSEGYYTAQGLRIITVQELKDAETEKKDSKDDSETHENENMKDDKQLSFEAYFHKLKFCAYVYLSGMVCGRKLFSNDDECSWHSLSERDSGWDPEKWDDCDD